MSSWTRADCQHRYQRRRRQGQARSLCVMRQEPAWTEHAGAEFMPAPVPLRSRVPVEFGRAARKETPVRSRGLSLLLMLAAGIISIPWWIGAYEIVKWLVTR